MLSESAKAEGMASGDKYEQLQFKYDNCRNSLELVQTMLDELNETIDETAAEAKDMAIASFYTSMNSEFYGHLLDSIELVDRRLVSLKENKVKIPPQVLPLTIVFKQLLRFIKDSGIHPLDSTRRELMAEAEDLSGYTYIGEPFSYEGEKKPVTVEKPGWKYENTIIYFPSNSTRKRRIGESIMSEKQYYTAIDLGTTNSVIAYGNMQNNTMKPIVLEWSLTAKMIQEASQEIPFFPPLYSITRTVTEK